MQDTVHHSQSFFNKYVKRAGFFGLAVFALILVLGGGLMKQSLDMRSTAAETGAELRGNSRAYAISGYVYIDQNQSGERDTEEKGLSGAVVQITILKRSSQKVDQSAETKTDSFGYFKYQLPSGSRINATDYRVLLQVPVGYKTTSKNPINLENMQKNSRQIVEFGIAENDVVTLTPTLTCANIYLTKISPNSSCATGSDQYKSALYTCSDGYSGEIGDRLRGSCKSYAEWKVEAHQACIARSCQTTPVPTGCLPEPTGNCINPDGPCYIPAPPPGGYCPKPTCTPMPAECISPSSGPEGPIIVCAPPPGGWCGNSTPTPTPMDCTARQKCGQEYPACPTGTSCVYPGPIRSTPDANYYGTCIPDGCPLPL